MLIDSTWGNPDTRATGNGALLQAGKSQCDSHQKCPFPWVIWNSVVPCATTVHIPNGISISSAIFAGLAVVTDIQTIRPLTTDH